MRVSLTAILWHGVECKRKQVQKITTLSNREQPNNRKIPHKQASKKFKNFEQKFEQAQEREETKLKKIYKKKQTHKRNRYDKGN